MTFDTLRGNWRVPVLGEVMARVALRSEPDKKADGLPPLAELAHLMPAKKPEADDLHGAELST